MEEEPRRFSTFVPNIVLYQNLKYSYIMVIATYMGDARRHLEEHPPFRLRAVRFYVTLFVLYHTRVLLEKRDRSPSLQSDAPHQPATSRLKNDLKRPSPVFVFRKTRSHDPISPHFHSHPSLFRTHEKPGLKDKIIRSSSHAGIRFCLGWWHSPALHDKGARRTPRQ